MLGTPCSEPGHELLNAAGPIRCTGGVWTVIAPSQDSVASRAYRNLMAQYWANPESDVKLHMVSDSATAFLGSAIERSMRAADRLWSANTAALEPYPVVIAHDRASLHLHAQQLNLKVSFNGDQTITAQEAAYGICASASYNYTQAQPWFHFCFTVDSATLGGRDLTLTNVGAHEFTHLAQYALMGDIQGWRTGGRMAPWFAEGMSSYVAVVLGSVSGAGGDLRTRRIGLLESTTATLADFNYTNPFSLGDVYILGMFASEAFYALAGKGAMEKVLRACGTGLKFDAALEKSTGKPLSVWTPVLTAYIDSVKAGTPLTLPQLQEVQQRAFAGAK